MSRIGRPHVYPLDPWIASVTSILMISNGRALEVCGVGRATGFFYRKNEEKYLITNRHAVIKENRGFYPDSLRIRIHTSNVTFENVDITIPLYDENREPKWLEHPNERENVDVVAININSYIPSPNFITYWSRNHFLPSDEVLTVGHQTLILGYPMGFYDELHNLPITKSGTLASPYGIYFRGKPFFLIDANLQSGTSGSPVILSRRFARQLRNGSVAMGTFPANLLGINSGEYSADVIKLGLNQVWYSSLIEDIVSR